MKLSNVSPIEEVTNGVRPLAIYRPQYGWSDVPPRDIIMLAGSFRPLHRGHRALLAAGFRVCGRDLHPCFEISIRNVEKPDIAAAELLIRVSQFREPGDTVVVTGAATFLGKARLMPGTTFVIGYDTAIRLFDDRFYLDIRSSSPSIAVMSEIRELGSSFVVGGRHDADGTFQTIRNMGIPKGFESLLVEIPEEMFSDPISSTQIRRDAVVDNP